MNARNKSAQTMRIDVQPGFADELPGVVKTHPVTVYESADTTFLTMKDRKSRGVDYDRLLQSIYDAVLVTDTNGIIADYNARAVSLFEWGNNDVIGTNIFDSIMGAGNDLLATILKNLSDSRHTMLDAICLRGDGHLFPSEIAVNSMELDGVIHMCFFVRDVTVRKRAQEALEDAVARLEAHDRARTQFVSNVSHELRTPLTSMIYAVTNMLKGVVGPLPERVRKYLEMMDGDCKRLLGTVNDILDMRKMDDKTLALLKTKFPLAKLIERAVNSLRVQADQKKIVLTLDEGKDNWFVDCDPQKIERVILNIVGNACKFTGEGGSIHVYLENDPDNEGYVRCSVRDDGLGIPENMIEHVTERYFTVGEQAMGSGLGLALSKEIVELHGGGIGIASPPPGFDKGTIVSIILPRVDAPRIFVLDDEELITELMGKQLSHRGYRVLTANDPMTSLEVIEREKPDVVIMDMIMPLMHGADLIMKMKSEKSTMRVPIIVVTGGNVDSQKVEILNRFSIPALSKPWKEEDLLDKIAEAFLGKAALNANIV